MIRNNIFSSFGRTLGRILCYILIGLVIAFITGKINVNAMERSDNFLANIKYLPSLVQAYNWSSSTNHTAITSTKNTFGDLYPSLFNESDKLIYPVFNSGSEIFSIPGPLGSNGRSFVFNLNQRISKDMYTAVTTYICYTGGDLPQVSRVGVGDSFNTALTTTPKYKSTSRMYITPLTWRLNGASIQVYCGAYFSIVQPNEQSFAFHIRMDGVNNSNIRYFLMGYDLESLGNADSLTASQLDTIIKNSGLATASSVNEVKTVVKEIKQEANNINNTISSDEVDDPSNSINSFKDKIAENGVITQLIGLPVTLFTKVLNSLNGTCTSYNLGSLFGTDIVFPCINISNYLGSTLWSVIDVLISGLFVYSISKKFIKVFEHMSSMNEGDVIDD